MRGSFANKLYYFKINQVEFTEINYCLLQIEDTRINNVGYKINIQPYGPYSIENSMSV